MGALIVAGVILIAIAGALAGLAVDDRRGRARVAAVVGPVEALAAWERTRKTRPTRWIPETCDLEWADARLNHACLLAPGHAGPCLCYCGSQDAD
jgi:hypothetical protein